MFMLAISIGIAVAQYVYADAYGITLVGTDGQPLRNIVQQITNVGTMNTLVGEANGLNSTNIGGNPLGVAAGIAGLAVTLVELVTGTYVFDILYHLGVPTIFIVGMIMLYIALLARAILGWIRGVF
jgi:hypothetical protein